MTVVLEIDCIYQHNSHDETDNYRANWKCPAMIGLKILSQTELRGDDSEDDSEDEKIQAIYLSKP